MTDLKIAIITGGRKFTPTTRSEADLRNHLSDVALVIEGEARGFDSYARDMASRLGIAVQPVPALWGLARATGRPIAAEGPIRNARMLWWGTELSAEYQLDLILIAAPGGPGTADMRRRCSGIPIREVRR